VSSLAATSPRPDAVVVTGDLADDGYPLSYERARELLEPLGDLRVFALPGNHDDREALRAAFGLPGRGDEPIRYSAAVGELRLIACDTLVPGSDAGSFDAGNLDWLDRELALEPGWPTVIAMHHPPILTGLDALDEIGLPPADRRGLGELIARSPQVVGVIAGHVHRGASGALGGRPAMICPSTNLQSILELGLSEFRFGDDPPGWALHALVDAELISHVQPVA